MTRRHAIDHLRTVLFLGVGAATVAVAMHAWLPGSTADDRQQSAAGGDLPQPVLDTHHLMELFNKPYFLQLKEDMQQQPAGDEGWTSLQERGLQAAELTNLIAIRKIDDKGAMAWQKHTRETRQAGLALAEVAKSKDWPQTQAAYQNLVRSCNSCHQDIAPDHAPQLKP